MTKTFEFNFTPKAGKAYDLEVPGAAVFVKQGGWPGLRMVYDAGGVEAFEGERSSELQDGKLLLRPFKKARIVYPAAPVPTAQLILQVFDCIDLAFIPQESITQPQRTRYLAWIAEHQVAADGDTGVAIEEDLVASTPVALAERGGDNAHLFYSSDSYLGGALRADEQFIVRLYHVVTFADGTVREMNVGLWTSAASVAGPHVVSLEHGMTRVWTAGVSSGMTPLPKPGFRLSIKRNAAGALNNLSGVVYSRSLL